MKEESRPDPYEMLKAIKHLEERENRGKLKIFFGMSAGVGKTFAMLKAAHKLKDDGVDVVAGYVETHGRNETDELLDGLEIIPRLKFDYHGIVIEDFDLDAVLERKPEVVLVDELAHTNVEGMRHSKRYNDVIELIDRGVSVYTTVNVQHIKSQSDIVEQITGIKVHETVPDSIIDRADSIELIDISPDVLQKRLSEGKVYIPERAELAAKRFFRKGNITALREMALNYVARAVDSDMRDYMQQNRISGPWKAGDRLLVAVSPSPYSEYLIKWTRRMAFNQNAAWVALYIEKKEPLSEADIYMLKKNLNLARELGAEVISITDEDIVKGLIRVAKDRNISQIIIGKPLRTRLSDYFKGGNIVERLLKISGDIEVHIVTQPEIINQKFKPFRGFRLRNIKPYILSVVSVVLITLLNLVIVNLTGYWTIALIYLLYITAIAMVVERIPVFVAALLSSIAWNFLFIPPILTFRIARIEDIAMFITYFVIAFIVGGLTSKLREKEWALTLREKRITELYDFSILLGGATDIESVIRISAGYIEEQLGAKSAFILTDDTGGLHPEVHSGSSLDADENMHGVAEWVFKNRKHAGTGTDTLSQANGLFIPLNAGGHVIGVICIRRNDGKELSYEQNNFLTGILYQISLRIEREILSAASRKTQLIMESERIYRILLDSISHELRTPLTTITGAASSLLDEVVSSKPHIRNALLKELCRASNRMNRLVDNLLDMSRLEAGMMKLEIHEHDINDLVNVVIKTIEGELDDHKVLIDIPSGLPMINCDFVLMEQTIINLVYNALIHTPAGTEIKISAKTDNNDYIIAVSDNGPGFSPGEIPYLFDRFLRGATSGPGGTGLGLSICRAIVEAHSGNITARNRGESGAEFVITIPLELTEGN